MEGVSGRQPARRTPGSALPPRRCGHGTPILRLAPCRANFLPYRGVVEIGCPMFLRVRHNACVPLTVGQTRRTVSIGAGHCPS
jgi:hypothetical protein